MEFLISDFESSGRIITWYTASWKIEYMDLFYLLNAWLAEDRSGLEEKEFPIRKRRKGVRYSDGGFILRQLKLAYSHTH